jgi:hypothetical protein
MTEVAASHPSPHRRYGSIVCSAEPTGFQYPEPALSISNSLSVFSLDVFAFVPPPCVSDSASFYSGLLFVTAGPLAVIAGLFAFFCVMWPAFKWAIRCFGPPLPWDERLAYAQGYAIIVLGFVLSPVSTTIIRTFICTEFDDGIIVLSAEMTLSCDPAVDPARPLWVAYALLMLLIYPICAPLTML